MLKVFYRKNRIYCSFHIVTGTYSICFCGNRQQYKRLSQKLMERIKITIKTQWKHQTHQQQFKHFNTKLHFILKMTPLNQLGFQQQRQYVLPKEVIKKEYEAQRKDFTLSYTRMILFDCCCFFFFWTLFFGLSLNLSMGKMIHLFCFLFFFLSLTADDPIIVVLLLLCFFTIPCICNLWKPQQKEIPWKIKKNSIHVSEPLYFYFYVCIYVCMYVYFVINYYLILKVKGQQ